MAESVTEISETIDRKINMYIYIAAIIVFSIAFAYVINIRYN